MEVKKYIRKDTLIYIDRSDYAKPYTKQMEHYGLVWDGSEKKVVKGYWGFSSIAEIGDKELLPLINFPYYLGEDEVDEKGRKRGWGFKSENEAMEYGYSLILKYFGNKGIWIEDRGMDDKKSFQYKYEKGIKFITRLKKSRSLLSQENTNIGSVLDVVKKTELKNYLYYEMEKNGRKRRLSLGSKKVRVPGVEGVYTLVILRDDEKMTKYGKKAGWKQKDDGVEEDEWFIAVLTNLEVKNDWDEEKIIRKYFRRWGVEDSLRFVKQEFGVESFLVREFRAIRRLIIICFMLMGLLFLIVQMGENVMKYLEKICDAFVKDVRFLYYRATWGIRKLFATIRSP